MGDLKATAAHQLTTAPWLCDTMISCSTEAPEGVIAVCDHGQVILSNFPWGLNCGSFLLRMKCRNNNSIWWVVNEELGSEQNFY